MAFADLMQEPSASKPSRWVPAETHAGGVQHSSAISDMQNAILKLDLLMHGHEAFNAFLSDHYLQGAKLDKMGTVGNVDKHGNATADGSWGARTDEGLKEVGQLATALSKVQADMKVPGTAMNPSQFLAAIPASYKDVQDAPVLAKRLADDITSLTEYYGDIANFITKRYGNMLGENTAVVKYKGTGLTPDEQDYATKHGNDVVFSMPYAGKGGVAVKLQDLSSPQAFAEFLHENTTPGNPVPDINTQAAYILHNLGGTQ